MTIDPGSCSRKHGSGCDACVESCPQAALHLTGEGQVPAFDPTACIGCGICTVACPTAAIAGVGVAPKRLMRAAETAADKLEIRCGAARTAARSEMSAVDVLCLAAVHPETVAAAAVRLEPGGTLTLVRGDCASCPVGAERQVEETVSGGVALSAQCAGDRTVVVVTAGENREGADPLTDTDYVRKKDPVGISRRGLIRGLIGAPAPRAGDPKAHRADKGREDSPATPAPVSGAVSESRRALLAVAPHAPMPRPFAGPGCTACQACSGVCPTGALVWGETSTMSTLGVDEQACIACGECVRVCPENVLSLGCTLPGQPRPSFGSTQITRVQFAGCDRCGRALRSGETGTCTRCSSRRSVLDDVWGSYG
ncbi:4Fe-4S dicluster domain-containing protein [Cryobacterium fucosi]